MPPASVESADQPVQMVAVPPAEVVKAARQEQSAALVEARVITPTHVPTDVRPSTRVETDPAW